MSHSFRTRTNDQAGPIIWFCILAVTCLLLALFRNITWLVVPFIAATILYYMLLPMVTYAMSRGLTRSRAVQTVTVLLLLAVAIVTMTLGPYVSSAARSWRTELPKYAKSGAQLAVTVKTSLQKSLPFSHKSTATPKLPRGTTEADDLEQKVADWTSNYSGNLVLEVLRWIPSLILIPYLTYFFLLDGPRFKKFLVRAIPNAFFEKALYLFFRVDDQVRRYFQGLMALTALDTVAFTIGLWVLGFPVPFFFGLMASVFAWLPYIGSALGCFVLVIVAATKSPDNPTLAYETVLVFFTVRTLDGFLFMPMTVGRSLSMHPLLTVVMILVGGAVGGVPGLLIVLPLLGVVMVAGQIIGQLLSDERILARHHYARTLHRHRARLDLLPPGRADHETRV